MTGTAPRRVVVQLIGGLGNQLFQVAHAYRRSLRSPSVRLDVGWYAHVPTSATPRRLGVDAAEVGLPFVALPRAVWSRRLAIAHVEGDGARSLRARAAGRLAVLETGYWQSWNGVEAVALPMHELIQRMCDRQRVTITPGLDYVAVHARLGDYLEPRTAAVHGLTDVRQQLDLADQLRAAHGIARIRVFTDSPGALADLGMGRFDVDVDESQSALAALAGMASASALVMSNSSLSWWAAVHGGWLGGGRMAVTMPRPWLLTPSRYDDALPAPVWRRYDRDLTGGPGPS